MSVYVKSEDRIVFDESEDEKKDIMASISRINKGGGEPPTTSAVMEREKRIRREIANSNERRRMQSINNGFQSLRSLLPHHEGEKLSKAAILQQTAEYIYSLEQEKTRLLSQNCQLKRLVNQHEGGELPPKKRKAELVMAAAEEEAELITVAVGGAAAGAANETAVELKRQLERERAMRLILESQVRQLEQQIFQQQQQQQQTQIFELDETDSVIPAGLQLVAADSLPPVGHTQTVSCSPTAESRGPSPQPPAIVEEEPQPRPRLPSVLEAAIKAEPKVEVERLPSPNTGTHETVVTVVESPAAPLVGGAASAPSATTVAGAAHLYQVSNTSRQNLETIVEAIRHLEGDHMFSDDQEAPLALTTSHRTSAQQQVPTVEQVKGEMRAYLEFAAQGVQQQQQHRPGVIVVKQAS